ncbi:MAG: carboxypeptidase regulatory-like domain-containing protein [Opitutaceae bacterium]|jgi:hypothetical protein|nr:carboxypeptidase regulatory-like domain-containing protein [Opitutaceae bacterium]
MKLSWKIRIVLRMAVSALCLAAPAAAQLVNTSVRVKTGTGDDTLVTGFVIGATPKTYMFRAVGPTLGSLGVSGVLADPVLTLYSGQQVVISNDNWSDNPSYAAATIAQVASSAGAFPLPANSRDAVVIATLTSGAYTVHVSGVAGGTGVALFEAYEISAPPAAGGRIEGRLVDARDGAGIVGTKISFRNSAGSEIGSATTGVFGIYSVVVPAGAVTVVFPGTTGYVSVSVSVTVVSGTTLQAPVLRAAPNLAGTGTVGGRVTNAITGGGIGGATVRFRSGIDVRAGTVVGSVTTDTTGAFTIPLPSGTYTAEIIASGFVTSYFTSYAVGGQASGGQNFTLSPTLGANELRIVLTWGSTPADLDAHLTGPHATIAGARFHVFFDARSETANTAKLDLDDEDSFGPETISIYQTRTGVYRYSVHDYTNSRSLDSTALSYSGAQVVVYQGTAEVARFAVPSGRAGNLWTVFEMDGQTKAITPRNEFSFVDAPLRVQAPIEGGSGGQQDEVLRIPSKPKR